MCKILSLECEYLCQITPGQGYLLGMVMKAIVICSLMMMQPFQRQHDDSSALFVELL